MNGARTMAGRELQSWVSDQLHGVIGYSDKVVAECILAEAKRARSADGLLQTLCDTYSITRNKFVLTANVAQFQGGAEGGFHRLSFLSWMALPSVMESCRWYQGRARSLHMRCGVGYPARRLLRRSLHGSQNARLPSCRRKHRFLCAFIAF